MVFDISLLNLRGDDALNWIADRTPNDVWQESSGRAIAGAWRDAGLKFTDSRFGSLRNAILTRVGFADQIADLPANQFIPNRWETQPLGYGPRRERSYRFSVSGSLPGSDDRVERFFNISVDDRLTKEQAENLMLNIIATDPDFYEIDPDEVSLVSVTRRQGGRT